MNVIDFSHFFRTQIIFMDNEEVFDLEVVLFNDATGGENVTNMNAVDMSLKLMVGRMKAVYLHKFIMELLVCILTILFFILLIMQIKSSLIPLLKHSN